MANANTEAQRRWRQRQKEEKLNSLKKVGDGTNDKVFKQPFSAATANNGNWSSFDIAFDVAGLEALSFDDDSGPKSFTGLIEASGKESGSDPYEGATNSLGRAEIMVGCLIDAAAELAGLINTYKRKEIQQRISEIEQSDLTDPLARKAALAQIVRLTKLLDQLDKQVRWTFKQWKINES